MKTILKQLGTVLLIFMLGGCYPEERIWWSPSGDKALVLIDHKLHLVTPDGQLGDALDGVSMKNVLVSSVSWLPDGNRFICTRERVMKSWDEVVKLIPTDEVKQVDALMPAVEPLLEAAVKTAPSAEKFDQVIASLPAELRTKLIVAVMRRYAEDAPAVEARLAGLPKSEDIIQALRKDGVSYSVDELCVITLKDGKVGGTRLIETSLLKKHAIPKVSPKHDVVACARMGEHSDYATLEVHPLDGGPVLTVTQRATSGFDWTPDGRSLVFMTPFDGESDKLLALHRLPVLKEDGKMWDPGDAELMKQLKVLATSVSLNRPFLQVLPDGRILFAAQPVTMPFLGSEPKEEPRLYLLAADGSELKPVPTAPGELPTDLGYFMASPDGTQVAIVEGGTDTVAVVTLATGKTAIVSPPHEGWKCGTIPSWKSNTELTFAALDGDRKTVRWMLWSPDSPPRSISGSWPAEATAKWLEAPKPENP